MNKHNLGHESYRYKPNMFFVNNDSWEIHCYSVLLLAKKFSQRNNLVNILTMSAKVKSKIEQKDKKK